MFLTDILIWIDSTNTYLSFSAEFSLRDNHGIAMFPKARLDYSMAGTRAASADLGLPFLWLMESFQNIREKEIVNLSMKINVLKSQM